MTEALEQIAGARPGRYRLYPEYKEPWGELAGGDSGALGGIYDSIYPTDTIGSGSPLMRSLAA